MGLPYSITKISNSLKLPKEFYWHAFNVLTQGNGLAFALNCFKEEKIKSKLNIHLTHLVLNHLLYRTLQYDKIMEFVPYNDIINGRPDIALPGCPVSSRTIKTIMAELSPKKSNFLFRLYVTKDGNRFKTPMRGFNLPGLMQLVEAWMYAAIDVRDSDKDAMQSNPDAKPSFLMLKNLYLLEQLNDLLAYYKPAFDFLLKYRKPIEFENVDLFREQLKKHLPTVQDCQQAKENIIEAKKHLKETKLKKWYVEKRNKRFAVKYNID